MIKNMAIVERQAGGLTRERTSGKPAARRTAFLGATDTDLKAMKAVLDNLQLDAEDMDMPEEHGTHHGKDTLISLSRELARTMQPIRSVMPKIDAVLQDRIARYNSGELKPLTQQECEESNHRLDKKFAALRVYVQSL
jgi:hypothetical protein